MNKFSVLLPVAATSDPQDLYRAHQSIVDQKISPNQILIVTNQPLPQNIEAKIHQLINSYATTDHRHFSDVQGLGGVLQEGLKECSEPFVARMDADDISEPDRFTNQLDVLSDTNVDIIGSYLAEFHDDPEIPERIREVPLSHNEIAKRMSWRSPLNHPTAMFDREAVLEAGGYRDFPMMEDWDLWARCLSSGLKFRNLDATLVKAEINNMVDRRGGFNYAKAEIRMARELRKLGISSRKQTIQHLCLRIPPPEFYRHISVIKYTMYLLDDGNITSDLPSLSTPKPLSVCVCLLNSCFDCCVE